MLVSQLDAMICLATRGAVGVYLLGGNQLAVPVEADRGEQDHQRAETKQGTSQPFRGTHVRGRGLLAHAAHRV